MHGPSTDTLDLEILGIDWRHDDTVLIRARERPRYNETAIYSSGGDRLGFSFYQAYASNELHVPSPHKRSMRPHRFSSEARAPLPEHRPVLAPPRAPVKRLHHFASPRVWARRNRPTPPRKEPTCPTKA
jgi:hypothetical protein